MPSIASFLNNEQGGEDSARNEQDREDLTHHGPHLYLYFAIAPMPVLHIVPCSSSSPLDFPLMDSSTES